MESLIRLVAENNGMAPSRYTREANGKTVRNKYGKTVRTGSDSRYGDEFAGIPHIVRIDGRFRHLLRIDGKSPDHFTTAMTDHPAMRLSNDIAGSYDRDGITDHRFLELLAGEVALCCDPITYRHGRGYTVLRRDPDAQITNMFDIAHKIECENAKASTEIELAELYNERVAIIQYDGGLTEEEAKDIADVEIYSDYPELSPKHQHVTRTSLTGVLSQSSVCHWIYYSHKPSQSEYKHLVKAGWKHAPKRDAKRGGWWAWKA